MVVDLVVDSLEIAFGLHISMVCYAHPWSSVFPLYRLFGTQYLVPQDGPRRRSTG